MPVLAVYVTFPNEDSAQAMADQLLGSRLIACANIFPIRSAYWWENQITKDAEWVAIFKTATNLEQQLENAIMEVHPYEVPCIIRWEIRANLAYEAWIHSETKQVIHER
jgi:periplasmic divalent cation tolerance protein